MEKNERTIVRDVDTSLRTRKVHNRNNHKVELVFNGEVVVFPPKSVVTVPADVVIPNGIGLFV